MNMYIPAPIESLTAIDDRIVLPATTLCDITPPLLMNDSPAPAMDMLPGWPGRARIVLREMVLRRTRRKLI